jgi:hypothetical protein
MLRRRSRDYAHVVDGSGLKWDGNDAVMRDATTRPARRHRRKAAMHGHARRKSEDLASGHGAVSRDQFTT